MPIGTVKWFNSLEGLGYIEPDEGDNPLILFTKDVAEASGEYMLSEGTKVEFEIEKDKKGRACAKTIKTIDYSHAYWRDINIY